MVDETRVLRLLRAVRDDLERLNPESRADEARRRDPMWLPGVKYLLITAIGGCVDVAQHLCSSEGWGPPADNGDAVRQLARHDVLDRDLAPRLTRAVGFGNVLVHEYASVDDDVVLARLQDLSDIDAFLRRVAEWIPLHL